jgi:diguanylate cyclase (GGDEF)-like protein
MVFKNNAPLPPYDPHALLNIQPVNLAIIDPVTYKVLYQNKASQVKFGSIADQLCHEKIAGCPTPCSFCKAPEALRSGTTTSSEVHLPNNEWVLVQWSVLDTIQGEPHLVETFTDITPLKRQQQESDTLNRRLEEANRQLAHTNRQLADRSVRDGLTGLYNHSYFQEMLGNLSAYAHRTHAPISLIFLDLDHFKAINDLYGHAAGDQVLQAMGGLLDSHQPNDHGRRIGRTSDVAARYGGDEFVLLLPNTDVEGALTLAERLHHRVGALALLPELAALATPPLSLTCSIGVASLPAHARTSTELMAAADHAVYLAKAAGRNCLRVFSAPERC